MVHVFFLWLAQVLLRGRYKLIVAQPDPAIMSAITIESGWRARDGARWRPPDGGARAYGCAAYEDRSHFAPCLFDVVADEREVAAPPRRLVTSSSPPRHFIVTLSSPHRHFVITSSSPPRHLLVAGLRPRARRRICADGDRGRARALRVACR